jgi:molybdopterin/thiamine biosynthesis adenylyltransferase
MNESARTLAQLAQIGNAEAEELFSSHVHVQLDPQLRRNKTYELAFAFAINLLGRMFRNLSHDELSEGSLLHIGEKNIAASTTPRIILRFGKHDPDADGIIAANCKKWQVYVDCEERIDPDPGEEWNPVLALVTACYAASRVASRVFGSRVCAAKRLSPFSILDFRTATTEFNWTDILDMETAHFAGIGAVGSATLFALAAHGVAAGVLILVDHDIIDHTNLDRYCLFRPGDVSKFKVDVAKARIERLLPQLRIVPEKDRLEQYVTAAHLGNPNFRIGRLISAPDRRDVRREFQALLPKEIWDASTGPDDLIVHHNTFTPDEACLACIYPPDPTEDAHFKHVADVLNAPFQRVKSGQLINKADAELIIRRYPHLALDELGGRPFDTVFRQLCSLGQIQLESGDEVAVSPFPFVSALAGVVLYFEIVKSLRQDVFGLYQRHNFLRVNPFFGPNPSLLLKQPPLGNCALCQNETVQRVFAKLWA